MLVRIAGRLYPLASPTELSLRDLIDLERVTTNLGMPINLGIMEQHQEELDKITAPTPEERNRIIGQHPFAQMLFAVNLYSARRKAGDDCTFDDCLDLSPADVEWVTEPGDDVPDPTARPLRKASEAGVKRPADKAPKAQRKTSKTASTAA